MMGAGLHEFTSRDLVVLNPTRELIHASHSTSHPHPHHVQRLKDVVTHCPISMVMVPFRGYHVVRYNVITPKWNAVAKDNNPLVSVHDVGGLAECDA